MRSVDDNEKPALAASGDTDGQPALGAVMVECDGKVHVRVRADASGDRR